MSQYEPHPFHASVVAAAQEAGIPFNDDHNGATLDGVGFAQLNIRDGVRDGVADRLPRPGARRPRR